MTYDAFLFLTHNAVAPMGEPPKPSSLRLYLLPTTFAVARLAPRHGVPHWAVSSDALLVVASTPDETSVVCAEALVPDAVQAERGLRAFRVAGPIPFGQTGVLAALAMPLAEAGVSIFAVSTYDTDCVLVGAAHLDRAIAALRAVGHDVSVPTAV